MQGAAADVLSAAFDFFYSTIAAKTSYLSTLLDKRNSADAKSTGLNALEANVFKLLLGRVVTFDSGFEMMDDVVAGKASRFNHWTAFVID